VQFISRTKISHVSLNARFSVTGRDTSIPDTLESLPVEDCSLGLLPVQSRRVMMRTIVEYEEFYANQQRDHRSGLREFREG
jgi:hypothetical protein